MVFNSKTTISLETRSKINNFGFLAPGCSWIRYPPIGAGYKPLWMVILNWGDISEFIMKDGMRRNFENLIFMIFMIISIVSQAYPIILRKSSLKQKQLFFG